MIIEKTWTEFKDIFIPKGLTLYMRDDGNKYVISCYEGDVEFNVRLPKNGNEEVTDFETNYKSLAGVPLLTTPKPFRGKSTTVNGIATILCKVPGTFPTGKRWMESGEGWFERQHFEDHYKVSVVDHDNLLGYGVDTVLKCLYDEDASEENQGWYINPYTGKAFIRGFDRLMDVMSGLYIKIEAHKGDKDETGFEEDTFRFNIYWGKIG